MIIKFAISEFNITGEPIPEDVCDKLLKWHIAPMMDVRNELDIPIWASQESGYRPESWENKRGRSGNSQHCFHAKGAVDWTCKNFSYNKNRLVRSIIKNTDYTRIAIYDSFIHCDYKATNSGRRELYLSGSNSKWEFEKYV